MGGHAAADQLGQAHLVDDLADRGAHRHPEIGQIFRGSLIAGLFRPQTAYAGERPVDRPEETRYTGSAENLPNLWVAVRAAVREVVDEVSLAELLSGRMPAHVRKLTTRPDAWQPR